MESKPDKTHDCKNPGCLDDGYILTGEKDQNNEMIIKQCNYCHNTPNSRFAREQVKIRLLGAKYYKRYHRYERDN